MLHYISLSVMPVVLCACIVMLFLSNSVWGESLGQLGEGLGRTGGWGPAREWDRVAGVTGVCLGPVFSCWFQCCYNVTGFSDLVFGPLKLPSTNDSTWLCHRRGRYTIKKHVISSGRESLRCWFVSPTQQPSRQEKTLTVHVSMNTGYVAFQRKK